MLRRDFLAQTAVPLAASMVTLPRGLNRSIRPVPTPSQLAWHQNELSLFLHFGVNTFTDREWGDGTEDPAIFNPVALDARQWIRAAKAGGFRTAILTAKHHDGFCLWPSRLTDHSVRSSPWREGRGDVVREFTEACREEGLIAGLYLSPWDRHEPSYGDSPRYNDFYIAQLTELLTQYGPIGEIWFDGANGEGPNGKRQSYDWSRIHGTVRRLAPRALMFSDAGPDLRWIGNEKGTAGDPNWCMMDPAAVPYAGADGPGIIDALQHGDPHGSVWRPGEADVSIRPGWFYHPAEDDKVRTVLGLRDLYFSSVGRNAGLLLNVPPNRSGLISPIDATRMGEFGDLLAHSFSHDQSRSAQSASDNRGRTRQPGRVFDPDPSSHWDAPMSGGWLQLDFSSPIQFNVVSIQEAIASGQSVSAHRVEAWSGSEWSIITVGTTVGARRLHTFQPVTTTRVRLSIMSALDSVRISRVGLFKMDFGD
ncbi:MAG: alpha-L-fucosidase [Gemmatimonadota bacterium]